MRFVGNTSALTLMALAGWLLALSPGAQATTPHAHDLVRVFVSTAADMAKLEALDLDLAACSSHTQGPRHVDVIADEDDIEVLRDSQLPFRIEIRDLEAHHAGELAKAGPFPNDLTPPIGRGAMGGHYTLAQMVAILDELAARFPAIAARRVSIGKSVEGRDIWMVKISDNVAVDEDEPEVLFNALHHAREPVSMEATMRFMQDLVEGYGEDPEATFIVNERELYFVPCVNPDGYEHNLRTHPNGGGMWRKNRRDNQDGTYGVDLNRNYPVGWEAPHGGNSTRTGSSVYRGPAPMSEPEVQALVRFSATRSFVQVVNTHTYSDVLLRPWGHRRAEPANGGTYDVLGDIVTESTGIVHGRASAVLYTAAGIATDYQHHAHGSYAWTPELGRRSEGGFWPNPVNTMLIVRRHQPMYRAIALTSGSFLDIQAVDVGALPGGRTRVTVRVRNRGLEAPTSLTVSVLGQSKRLTPPSFGDDRAVDFVVSLPDAATIDVVVRGGGQTIRASRVGAPLPPRSPLPRQPLR